MGLLENMRIFVRIVDAGSISKAAEQLNTSKSVVSKRLNELETHLGSKLIHRTTRRSSLTTSGNLYYQKSKVILDEVDNLYSLISMQRKELTGTLKIAAPMSFGIAHLSSLFDQFMKKHPALILEIDFSDRQINIIEDGFDLAIRIGNLSNSSLHARELAPIRFGLCASPGYLQQYGTPTSFNDLKNHHLLQYNHYNYIKARDANGKEHTMTLPSKLVANNGDVIRNMAIADHGIIMSPTFITWKAIAEKKLIPLLTDYHFGNTHAYALYPSARYLPKKIRHFIDFIAAELGPEPYWDREVTH